MKIISLYFGLLVLSCLSACRNNNKPLPAATFSEKLSKTQTDFINQWNTRFNEQQAPVLCLFKNRHINRTDLKELDYYLKHIDSTADFSAAKESLRIKTELGIDTLLTQNIHWINDNDVTTCNKVDPDFWNCFILRYNIEGFYYLSEPLLSADQKWCLMSVNYLSKYKGQSFGGGRLYHFEKQQWKEAAYLSYWGKQPE